MISWQFYVGNSHINSIDFNKNFKHCCNIDTCLKLKFLHLYSVGDFETLELKD